MFPYTSHVFVMLRLSKINDRPYAVQKTYIPAEVFWDADRYDFAEGSLYDYMDTGPFSDINRRLNLKSSSSRISTSSRAAIYEAIAYTDAYYLNSDYSVCPYFEMDGNMRYLPQRTLRLKDCGIKSVIGWIKRTDQPLAPVAQEMVGMFYEYLAVDDSPEILAEDW